MNAYRVWAEVDLDALGRNLEAIRRRIGPLAEVVLVVKADAYGHGAVAVAHRAVRHGVSGLGVGTSAEALELRQAGVVAPILVLGTIVDREAEDCLLHRIEIGLHSSDRLRMLHELGRRLGVRAGVHLNVDTGMGRLGVLPDRAIELLRQVAASPHLEMRGVMTHVTARDGALDPTTAVQMERFSAVLDAARREGLPCGRVHAANSACIFTGMRPLFHAVRPGIAAYGVLPRHLPGASELEPVMALRTQVVFLKDVPPGTTVGYGGTWAARRSSRIATLPVGYDDGVSQRLSNRGEVLVRGRRAPIVGQVSMDYATIDVTDVPDVVVGDVVTLIGRDGEEEIGVEDVARAAGTIAYEITCSVGKRVKRVYRGSELEPAERPRPLLPRGGGSPVVAPRPRVTEPGTLRTSADR